VGDTGSLVGSGTLTVSDCQVAAGYVLHVGRLAGRLEVGGSVTSKVDYDRRSAIVPNHTFTHVLNFALR
jgi:alanyl-tRNA synthetase